jgi:hypothetical protein
MIDKWVIGGGIVGCALIAIDIFILGGGMGYDGGIVVGYGCGRHDAMQTAKSDPAEYDMPPCVEARRLWERSEEWPPHR